MAKKNKTLRAETELLLDMADNFEDYYNIAYELKSVGKLIERMAYQISELQEKVDNQAEQLHKRSVNNYEDRKKKICCNEKE